MVNTTTAMIPARAACKGTKKMHFQLQKPSLQNKYLNIEIKGSKRSRRIGGGRETQKMIPTRKYFKIKADR